MPILLKKLPKPQLLPKFKVEDQKPCLLATCLSRLNKLMWRTFLKMLVKLLMFALHQMVKECSRVLDM
ncbi:hypothetical protein CsSME_00042716 [Camellia sinensis var. sinensis]